jgi:hypothetical protein
MTSTRLLASLLPLSLLVGCSAAPGTGDAETESASSAMVGSLNSGGIVPQPVVVDPTTACSAATPSASFPLPIYPNEVTVVEQGNTSATCAYGVVELTGTQGHTLDYYATDFHGTTWGAGALTQAQCAASFFGYDVMGWVPPHLVSGGIGPNGVPILKEIPGYWETMDQGSSAPAWASGHCMYSLASIYTLPITKYTKVRIATEALIDDSSGWHTIPLYLTVHS